MENSNEIFEGFMMNQKERIYMKQLEMMGGNNVFELALEKAGEEIIELLQVIQAIKKIEMVYKLKIIDHEERLKRKKVCFNKLCEELSHVMIATNYLGSSIDSSFDDKVSEEKQKKLKFMKDITEGNIR